MEKEFDFFLTENKDFLGEIIQNDKESKPITIEKIEEILNLLKKENLSTFRDIEEKLSNENLSHIFESFRGEIEATAEKINKEIEFNISKTDLEINSLKYKDFLSSLIHIFNKWSRDQRRGEIKVSLKRKKDSRSLSLKMTSGINSDSILKKAKKLKMRLKTLVKKILSI